MFGSLLRRASPMLQRIVPMHLQLQSSVRWIVVSAADYRSIEKIRNIGISAHIDSGKTTITERILFYTGRIKAIHEVRGKDGVGAKMDSMELEREKGITIQSAATYTHWGDNRINIIDTPGHVDFTIEVERALRVLDGSIMILCGVAGIQSQSITVDRQMKRYHIPRLCFINKLDRQNADAYRVAKDFKEKLNASSALVQIPIGSEDRLSGVIDLIEMRSIFFDGERGELIKYDVIHSEYEEKARERRRILVETLAEVDPEIEELYVTEEEPSASVLKAAVGRQTRRNTFIPIFLGSAFKYIGVQPLLDAVVEFLPDPSVKVETALDVGHKNKEVALIPRTDLPLVALAFKLDEGKFGQLTYLRVYQGMLNRGDMMMNCRDCHQLRVPRLVRMHSNEMEDIQGVGPGEIVAMFGVECSSGDTFTNGRVNYSMISMYIPEPVISYAISNKHSKDLENFSKSLKRFQREDPTFRLSYNSEKNETVIHGMGELHLEIYVERMRREYGCDVTVPHFIITFQRDSQLNQSSQMSPPRVNYRDYIQQHTDFNYLFKRQSGGQGMYAKVIGYIEPLDPNSETPYIFENKLVGLNIPPEYVPAIEKGFFEAMEEGKLTGHRVQACKFVIQDGQYHPVDSSELAFRTATKYAIAESFKAANPTVLEPVMKVEIDIPEEFQGNVIGGLNRRKGNIKDATPDGSGYMRLIATVPLSSMFGYSIELRQLTQGRGEFTMEYSHLDRAPNSTIAKLVEEYQATFKK